jgi:hypothetical protein
MANQPNMYKTCCQKYDAVLLESFASGMAIAILVINDDPTLEVHKKST